MAVTISDLMEHLNADDDEQDVVQGYLDRATATVNLYLNQTDSQFQGDDLDYFNSIKDQIILEFATNYYLHRDGATKSNFNNSSSLDSIFGSIRNPSL